MNPDSFFREVLESHELRSSDSDFSGVSVIPSSILFLCPIMQSYWT